jgi:RNA polymerase sigma-70 factor (ECF subfamily)
MGCAMRSTHAINEVNQRAITERQARASAAIETLYESHHDTIRAYLTRLVDDRAIAEELCHETFLKALRGWDQSARVTNAVAWLYRIATNTAYDHLRRRRRIRFIPLGEAAQPPSGAHSMESRMDEQEPVQRALAQLPAPARRLLVLCACAGHSAEEIAATLGCSQNAVRLRLLRARERFRQVYAETSDEVGLPQTR